MSNVESDSASAIFGLFSDIQYADIDDRLFGTSIERFYRNSVKLMKSAVSEWQEKYPGRIKFILHLGDLIDSQALISKQQDNALKTLLDAYDEVNKDRVPLYHAWGNHEMYNFERNRLIDSPLHTGKILGQSHDSKANYYRLDVTDNLSLLVLDFYRFSVIGYDSNEPECQEAYSFMRKYNKNNHINSTSGLSRDHMRFVAFNGGLGEKQTKWLESQLESCELSGRRVIVCGHIPLHWKASANKSLAWDADQVLEILRKRPGLVLAYLCGHYHPGAYHLDKSGIHHVTFKAILETPKGNSYATVYAYPNKVVFAGVGENMPSFEVEF